MKTMQIMLRHRVAPMRARAAVRQFCVWVNPPEPDYMASYDPLIAKWSAFEKDMNDVRSQREGPLRWTPPSYKNEDYLLLQKAQASKTNSRSIRKPYQRSHQSKPVESFHNVNTDSVQETQASPVYKYIIPDARLAEEDNKPEINSDQRIRDPSPVQERKRKASGNSSYQESSPTIKEHVKDVTPEELPVKKGAASSKSMPQNDREISSSVQVINNAPIKKGPVKKIPSKKAMEKMESPIETVTNEYIDREKAVSVFTISESSRNVKSRDSSIIPASIIDEPDQKIPDATQNKKLLRKIQTKDIATVDESEDAGDITPIKFKEAQTGKKSVKHQMILVDESDMNKSENKSSFAIGSSFEERNRSQQSANDDRLKSSADNLPKDPMIFNKKKYDALRKYIAEAEMELRMQKQMLSTQKDDFTKRLRRMALNPLAEIERNSKITAPHTLQHPLDYFSKKNKTMKVAKKKISNETDIVSPRVTRHLELSDQSHLTENIESEMRNENYMSSPTNKDRSVSDAETFANVSESSPQINQEMDQPTEKKIRKKVSLPDTTQDSLDKQDFTGKSVNYKKRNQALANNSDVIDEIAELIEPSQNKQSFAVQDIKTSPQKESSVQSSQHSELSNFQTSSTPGKNFLDRGRSPNKSRSRSRSKDRYDYYDSGRAQQSNQATSLNKFKSKHHSKGIKEQTPISTMESYKDEPEQIMTNQEKSWRGTKEDELASDEVVRHARYREVPDSLLNQENSSSVAYEPGEFNEPEMGVNDDRKMTQQRVVNAATVTQPGSNLLDRSRAKLRKHFMDRAAPVRINKNTSYIYQPSESTITTMTKTAINVDDNDFEGSSLPQKQSYDEENEEPKISQLHHNFVSSQLELESSPEQKSPKSPNLPKSIEQLENIDSPEMNNPTTLDLTQEESYPLKNTATSEQTGETFQEPKNETINSTKKLTKPAKDSGLISSTNNSIPEYDYFRSARPKTPQDILLNSVKKNFSRSQKNDLGTNESFETVQKRAKQTYDILLKTGELPGEIRFSKRQSSPLSHRSKAVKPNKNRVNITARARSPESYSSMISKNMFQSGAESDNKKLEYQTLNNDIQNSYLGETLNKNQREPHATSHRAYELKPPPQNKHVFDTRPVNNPYVSENGLDTLVSYSNVIREKPMMTNKHDSVNHKVLTKDISAQSKKSAMSNIEYNTDFQNTSAKKSVIPESNKALENNNSNEDLLKDIEEGIPSSRVKLRPPLDAFTSFGVGKVESEMESSHTPLTSSPSKDPLESSSGLVNRRSRSADFKDETNLGTVQMARAHSQQSQTHFHKKSSGNEFTQTSQDVNLKTLNKTKGNFSSRPSVVQKVVGNQSRISRRVREKYPKLFKNEASDPFEEIYPFKYEEREFPQAANVKVSRRLPHKTSQTIQELEHLTKESMFGSYKKPKLLTTHLSSNKKDDMTNVPVEQQGKAKVLPNDHLKKSAKSGYSDEFMHENSVVEQKVPRPIQSTDVPTQVVSPDQKTSTKTLTTHQLTSFETPATVPASLNSPVLKSKSQSATTLKDIEVESRRRPKLFKRPPLTNPKPRLRFSSPAPYNVENIESFFRVDESIHLPGSPIRKWKVPSRDSGRAIYVASIPQNQEVK